jgi:enediyne biosynthesis protein E4
MKKAILNINGRQLDASLKLASSYTSFFYITIILIFTNCNTKPTLFELTSSSKTGVKFKNTIVENEKFNVLDYMNIYTGAGVATGDINNDGLMDLYFSGNQTTGRLYLNKGNLQFEDITEKAGLVSDRWQTGVSMVDINQDGFVDIYVNVSGSEKFGNLANLLYINNQNGTFTEKAAEYGIAEKRLTMNSTFFDYDKDGDLDLFLITNPADEMVSGVNVVKERKVNGESDGTDILYRNDSPLTPKGGASGTTGGLHFTDVSRTAGILTEGYSLGAAISDFNQDGFPDIFVSNDFLSNDILYINNGDGTFTDRINEYMKHSSFASMGNDAADINNDGLTDLCVLDMLPEDNFRRKMIIPPTSYDKFQLLLEKGYTPSYTRNTLQLNNGSPPTPKGGAKPHAFGGGAVQHALGAKPQSPPLGAGGFSEISFLSGISATDWSWAALFADYDNDGDKDLMVTNGFYRDLGNLDYITYQSRLQNPMGRQDAKRAEKLKAIHSLENVPIQNYLFENNGDLTFTKRSDDWGFTEKGFSNGAVYVDLDNDGDLELVLNEFNSEAKIYENKANTLLQNHFLKVKLQGNAPNLDGFGSKITLYYTPSGGKGAMQFQEMQPSRGYESSVSPVLNFGLGKNVKVDSIIVVWADGNRQVETNISIDKQLTVRYLKSVTQPSEGFKPSEGLFATADVNIDFKHLENNYNDFKIQPLLPQLHSQGSPAMATGDVNGDGLEDFYISAAAGSVGCFFIQNRNGGFDKKPLPQVALADETGALFFDADGDKDLDLYIVGGGSEFELGSPQYQDRFYENDGKGNFKSMPNALPDTRASGSVAISCDYDHDGDLDIFVGGRVSAGAYPMPPRSYLLRNDSPLTPKGGTTFTDVTPQYLQQIGMITAANWVDIDNDGWADLVLVGEFMPLTFVKNKNGKMEDKPLTINNSEGWWSSLNCADFDGDGDMDFMAGNVGLNTRYKVSEKEPLCIYAKDFDKNGRIDPILCYYSQGINYMGRTRDELIKQIAAMRGRFESYKDFATAPFDKSFTKDELKDAYLLKATCFESCYFENKGNGQFEKHPLSINAQFSPINGILIADFDKDGHLDALLAGNSYAIEPTMGRCDASTGVFLKGDGKGHFTVLKSRETGFVADKDVKSLAKVKLKNGSELVLIGNNSARLEAYYWRNQEKIRQIK